VSSTCFEHPSVHPQEDLYMQFYGISFMPSTRLLIWMHERNNIKLHVQVFLRMNTWMSETCRRHYNLNSNINVKSFHYVDSYYIDTFY